MGWAEASRILPSRRVLAFELVLALFWIVVLRWGEKTSFTGGIRSCSWNTWENWPEEASPHRVVLVADPQLVDPHTYPGRPWPLSTLTELHTDQYMRRSFESIQDILDPTTVFFLGDLFDGGREWSTNSSESPLKEWRKYGEAFWLKEFRRFGRIFVDTWEKRNFEGSKGRRKMISSLPGNHDLGISNGVQLPVRDRFYSFFGDGNRIDVIGNHSFVSIDSVSLSAKAEQDGSVNNTKIWKPTDKFLDDVAVKKTEAWNRAMRVAQGLPENELFVHKAFDTDPPLNNDPNLRPPPESSVHMPTVLLTHVPLYRAEGTPCGPMRERWPQSKDENGVYLQKDNANAIRIAAGYQYQNVLHPQISKEIIEKVGDVGFVFSGDDHDYCDIVHHEFASKTGGVREITVKAFSWAMGVRKPGFLMLSLWNPVDGTASRPTEGEQKAGDHTLQYHLCLLPDQLSILIRYGTVLGLTIFLVLVHSAYITLRRGPVAPRDPILPTFQENSYRDNGEELDYQRSYSSSSNSSDLQKNMFGRKASARGKAEFYEMSSAELGKREDFFSTSRQSPRKTSKFQTLLRNFRGSIFRVAFIVLSWYAWLAWSF